MKELSLNILDIAGNSVKAGAKHIQISVEEDTINQLLRILISDDGCGMEKEFLKNVLDPFTTTRTTRKVGLGLPLLKMEAEQTGGTVSVKSEPGKGTLVNATFKIDHIDALPLGNVGETIATLIHGSPDTCFTYAYKVNGEVFELSTTAMKEQLQGVPVNSPEVLRWVAEYVEENAKELKSKYYMI